MTPTVLREDGFQFFFYSWESNEPPHVHVKKGGAYGKLWLAPVLEAYLEGFNPNEVRQIIAIVSRNREHLLQRWNETLVEHHRAKSVRIEAERLVVLLEDDREIAVPLSWFPRLQQAPDSARMNWELVGRGLGIHWPDIDEHVSVESLLHPERTIRSQEIRDRERRNR